MQTLAQLLTAYREGAPFPSYQQLYAAAEQENNNALRLLLSEYRGDGMFPTYSELQAIA